MGWQLNRETLEGGAIREATVVIPSSHDLSILAGNLSQAYPFLLAFWSSLTSPWNTFFGRSFYLVRQDQSVQEVGWSHA